MLLLFVFLPFFLPAKQKEVATDTSYVQLREPSKATQDKFYSDDYWRYDRDKQANESQPNVFDRIFNGIISHLFSSFSGKGLNAWVIFFSLVGVALIVFLILRLTDTGVNSVFSGKSREQEKTDVSVEDVDIHSIDYGPQIEGALRNGDYRLAVRLWFLRTLKKLSDKELLQWTIDKTNTDYYYELGGSNVQRDFGKISLIYDHIWYGETTIDKNSYGEAEEEFRELYSKIDR